MLPNVYEEIFFKLAHYLYCFSECNSISDIRPKHTDHCFQKKFNKIWSITIITRMPLVHKCALQHQLLDCYQILEGSLVNDELQPGIRQKAGEGQLGLFVLKDGCG